MGGLITAFDGFLSAEKAAGVKPWKNGKLPKITISWSYAKLANGIPCNKSGYIENEHECGASIGFMSQFYHALQDLNGTVQYTPVNDLQAAYKDRWITSLQTFVRSDQVYKQVLAKNLTALKDLQIYFGEYDPAVDTCGAFQPECKSDHKGWGYDAIDLEKDLKNILTSDEWLDKNSLGVSFFSYTEADNKRNSGDNATKNHELQYGLLNFSKQAPWRTGYILGDSFPNH